MLIPTVIERDPKGERAYDIYSRLLIERIIFVTGAINSEVANAIIAQLLFLQKVDENKPITMYVNSPGGEIDAGRAIIDTMMHVKAPISTISIGLSASMAALILTCGDKGKRFALPSASILIHQPLGGVEGQATDIEISAKRILREKDEINELLAKRTGQKISKIKIDVERDYWMSAQEAKKYGLIDEVLTPSKKM
jgi:ATP-dependent Clp protease protease subunit